MTEYDPPFILVIDLGSSSIRASLYDARARSVEGAEAREEHHLAIDASGAAVAIPEQVADRVERAIDGILAKALSAVSHIAAVSMDTMASTVLGVDSSGHPTTPIYTYADTQSAEDVMALRRELDRTTVYHRTGCPQHTSYLPGRIRWLRRTQPDVFARTRRWMDVGTFLYGRWFGRDVPASYSVASWTGLLDRHELVWDRPLLEHLSLPDEVLPPLADYGSPQRGLSRRFAARWPALKDTPFFLAVGDGAAANVGSGCVSPDRVALTVGTTGAMRVMLPGQAPDVPPGLWAYCVTQSHPLLGGSFNEGGRVYSWVTGRLRLPPDEDLEDALGKQAPDGHGLTVLPFLLGERSPGWSTSATASVHGMTVSTTAIDILQANLEAVAYRFRMVGDLLSGYLAGSQQLIASGGAITRSPFWMRVMADVLERPVVAARQGELTSRGTAALALRAIGEWRTLGEEPVELGKTFEPDKERSEIYRMAARRQQEMYQAIIGSPEV